MLNFIKSVLTHAGDIFITTESDIVGEKGGGGNWVTKKDLAIEKFVIDQIKHKFPNHTVLSEETELNISTIDKSNLWIFDPLDGTTNAFYNLPNYGISLAYSVNGEILVGATYNIPSKTLYWAEKGKGSFIKIPSSTFPVKLKTQDIGIKNALVCTGSPYARENFIPTYELMDKVHKANARLIILGSAVVASSYVAEGRLAMYFEKGLKPWDIAAVSLLIKEAGGIVRNLEGELDIFNPQTFICGGKKIVQEFIKLH